jgi:hypothetical protein
MNSDNKNHLIVCGSLLLLAAIVATAFWAIYDAKYDVEKAKIMLEAELNKERINAGQPATNSLDKKSTHTFEFGRKKD